MVIVLENRDYGSVIGSGSAPYINQLAARDGLATQFYATSHPSLPNYLELISGNTFGITSDCTSCTVEGQTIVDQLVSAGIGWRAYMEGMPAPCFTGASSLAGYAKKHDPFMYVVHLVRDPAMCDQVVPGEAMIGDATTGRLPPFVWLTPSLCADGHDCSTSTADSHLHDVLEPVLASSWYQQGGVVLVTWDEGGSNAGCCQGAHGGHVATLVIAASVPAGKRLSTQVDQAGLLRTIESLYGFAYLSDAACSCSGDLLGLLRK
jgi:hypothetical protein